MERDLKTEIARVLLRECGPKWQENRYVLAVSGGKDSMALLDLCARIPLSITVAHYDHNIRPDSHLDCAFVRDEAKKRGFDFISRRGTGEKADEATLRDERNAFLESALSDSASHWILTAHQAQDQAETLFMRMLRGSGVTGLAGIPPKRGSFVRPLLRVNPSEIAHYLHQGNLSWREDKTNADLHYFRNRIRETLMPVLKDLADPHGGEEKWLRRMSDLTEEIQRSEKEKEEELEILSSQWVTLTPFWARLRRETFLAQSPDTQFRLLRSLVKKLGHSHYPWSRERFERIRNAIREGQKGFSLTTELSMVLSCGWVFVTGRRELPVMEFTGSQWKCHTMGVELEVEDSLKDDLECRFFLPGDRYRHSKVKEWWQEKQVPRPERPFIPVAYSKKQRELVWIYPEPSPYVRVLQFGFPLSVQQRS